MTGVNMVAVAPDDEGMRLDRWFRRAYPQLTQGQIQKMLRAGQIRVDGKRAEANTRLVGTETIRVPPLPERTAPPPERGISEADAQALRRMVLFEDDWVIALNKPAGIAVQGGTRQEKHLDGMLQALVPEGEKPRLVHRLDLETSGVLLIAKTRRAAQMLGSGFQHRLARKYYWAITIGVPKPEQGRVEAALAKKPGGEDIDRMEKDDDDGKAAVSLYHVVDHAVKAAWVALWPVTGRTHQLRVHMELLGTPILGDRKYCRRASETVIEGTVDRLHLHARRIVMPHPSGKGIIDVTAPLPPELKASWDYFGFGKDDGDPFAHMAKGAVG